MGIINRTKNRTEITKTEAKIIETEKNQFPIQFQKTWNRNNRKKFGAYSRLTKLIERTELHVFSNSILSLYVMCHISITLLLLFSSQLLFSIK